MKPPFSDTDTELDSFKTKINLSEYAAYRGYTLDLDKSTSNSICMFNGSDKVIITKATNGHWIYFKVQSKPGDLKEGGSIIDFIQCRYSLNLGQIRKSLRPWLGFQKRPKLDPKTFVRNIKTLKKSEIDLLAEYHNLKSIDETTVVKKYLVDQRNIPENIIYSDRFQDKIKSDQYNNAIFPHWYYAKVVGWEIKNKNFTGFPKDSTKSVWFTNRFDDDNCLIITESGIDLLSFFALHPEHLSTSWGISTAGSWGPMTEEMITQAIKIIPGQKIIAAFDNDESGFFFNAKVKELTLSIDPNFDIRYCVPEKNDWNLDLSNKQ